MLIFGTHPLKEKPTFPTSRTVGGGVSATENHQSITDQLIGEDDRTRSSSSAAAHCRAFTAAASKAPPAEVGEETSRDRLPVGVPSISQQQEVQWLAARTRGTRSTFGRTIVGRWVRRGRCTQPRSSSKQSASPRRRSSAPFKANFTRRSSRSEPERIPRSTLSTN